MRTLRQLLVLVIAVIAAVWATSVVLNPPRSSVSLDENPLTVQVASGAIGRSSQFAAVASWATETRIRFSLSGTITHVPGAIRSIEAGDILYSVDLKPVVVAEGRIPAFRVMESRSEGADVAQLQSFLALMGFFQSEPDGLFGRETERAVRQWQTAIDAEVTGRVEHGAMVFLPQLPAVVAPEPDLEVGQLVTAGQISHRRLADEPVFDLSIARDQPTELATSQVVIISHPGGTWSAVLLGQTIDDAKGTVVFRLGTPDGGPVCGSDCLSSVPLGETTRFTANIVVVDDLDGPEIPVAALRTDESNKQYVMMADGERRRVDVLGADLGIAIVAGLEVGEAVVVSSQGS